MPQFIGRSSIEGAGAKAGTGLGRNLDGSPLSALLSGLLTRLAR